MPRTAYVTGAAGFVGRHLGRTPRCRRLARHGVVPAHRPGRGGVWASFKEVVNTIEELLGKPQTTRVAPRLVVALLCAASTATSVLTGREPELTIPKYRRAVGDLRVDDRVAREELGLNHTPLKQQLADTVAWLTQVGSLDPERVEKQ